MFIIHMDSQAEKQLPMLEKNWERYSAPKFEQKATPGAGNLACYWALKFERKEQLLIFEVSTGNMLNIDHLDIDPSDIMVFIYHSGRRLVESGQKIVFEREATIFIPTFCDTFSLWLENEKNIHKCPPSPVLTLHERVPSFKI